MKNVELIRICVRELVGFVLRGGSIDSRYMGAKRLADGVKAHQAIQRARKKEAAEKGYEYQSERRFGHLFEYNDIRFNVEGRADGVFFDNDWHIEEIKSTARELALIEDNELHWAQAKFYAYMLCVAEGTANITVLLTYCSFEKPLLSEAKIFSREFDFSELEVFCTNVLQQYYKWAKFQTEYRLLRNTSIKAGGFPYGEYRNGQRAFAVAVYRAAQQRHNLFIEAPTGTGKTMSALFPAVKALGEEHAEKIFYLTAKTITGQAAQAAAELLIARNYKINYVCLTSKDKLCPQAARSCRPEDCERAAGHFDRVNDAVWDAVNNEQCLKRQAVLDYAEKHCVCPHEFSLDLAMFADIVVGDCNYAFDPKASLKRFFTDGGEYVLLIDEAHNLIERAREMFSAQIDSKRFADLRRKFKARGSRLYKVLSEIIKAIRNEDLDVLKPLLYAFVEMADRLLAEGIHDADTGQTLLELYFCTLDYLRVTEETDERYRVFTEQKGKDVLIKLLCLDPSAMLRGVTDKVVSATFFSATLTPLIYFRNILGGVESDVLARLPSPFNHENLLCLIDARVSTKYNDRQNSTERICEALFLMTAAKTGNYFAFFPSFEYAEKVFDVYKEKYMNGDTDVIIQSRFMNEEQREDFLSLFETGNCPNNRGLLAFAVMGGIFSEGIDLIGKRLIGAAVISVGLPVICEERDVLRRYFDERQMPGFEYAYMYPGMNKVLQAIGRVIRSNNDKGVALLIDERFIQRRYTELFPDLWRGYRKVKCLGEMGKLLAEFWEDNFFVEK